MLPEYFGIFGARATDKLAVREADGDGRAAGVPVAEAQAPRHLARRRHGAARVRRSRRACAAPASSTVPTAGASRATTRSICSRSRAATSATTKDARSSRARSRSRSSCPAAASACRCATTCAFPSSIAAWATLALILVPSAFTATTGAAHWHLLLRARAVENQCYVLAAAQGGTHPGGRRTYGHSVLIDPWGRIVAEREEGPGHRRRRRRSRRASPRCARSCRRSRIACSDVEHAGTPGSRRSGRRSLSSRTTCRASGRVFGVIAMTEAEIVDFARRYDPQPIHTDAEAARRGPVRRTHRKRLAHDRHRDAGAGRALPVARGGAGVAGHRRAALDRSPCGRATSCACASRSRTRRRRARSPIADSCARSSRRSISATRS